MRNYTDPSGSDSSELKSTELGEQADFLASQLPPLSETLPELSSIGRYQLLSRLGNGGFGHVYLAEDPTLNRLVAIKVPRWDRPLSLEATKQFLYEGQMLARVDHPGIVSVFDYGVSTQKIPYVVMQFVDGETLDQTLSRRRRSIPEIVDLLIKIGEPLHAAHRRFLTHRDLKPGNVIVDADQGVHLVDFGLALHDEFTPQEISTKRLAGTSFFMSPEQMRGENHLIDPRTDIWAFGVMMYLMVSGRLPFKGTTQQDIRTTICQLEPEPLSNRTSGLDPELERICHRCLEKQMADRFQSMQEVVDDLNAWLEDAGRVNRREPFAPETVWSDEDFREDQGGGIPAAGQSGRLKTARFG